MAPTRYYPPRKGMKPAHRILQRIVLEDHGFETRCWTRGGELSHRRWSVGAGGRGDSMILAPRVMYEYLAGPIPEGYHLDHLCRVPGCANPTHLEPVTPRENTMRGRMPDLVRAKCAAVTHCPRGHAYDEWNTLTYTNRRGYACRACRTCKNDDNRQRARVRRAAARRYA